MPLCFPILFRWNDCFTFPYFLNQLIGIISFCQFFINSSPWVISFLSPPVILNSSGFPNPFPFFPATVRSHHSQIRCSQSGSSIKYLNISTPQTDSTDEIFDQWWIICHRFLGDNAKGHQSQTVYILLLYHSEAIYWLCLLSVKKPVCSAIYFHLKPQHSSFALRK